MDKLKLSLIRLAETTYGCIHPCFGHATLDTCFTIMSGKIVLWFNTDADHSTRTVSALIEKSIQEKISSPASA